MQKIIGVFYLQFSPFTAAAACSAFSAASTGIAFCFITAVIIDSAAAAAVAISVALASQTVEL